MRCSLTNCQLLAVFQNGLNSFYDSIEIEQPPSPLYPCCLLTLPIFYALSRLPQKTAALQFVSQATERQTDRRTTRQLAAAAAGRWGEPEGGSYDPTELPRGNCSQLASNNNNNNKVCRNLRYLCCECAINIIAPSGIDLANSIGRTDSGTDSSHSLWQ